jgi:hypothetical protein
MIALFEMLTAILLDPLFGAAFVFFGALYSLPGVGIGDLLRGLFRWFF